MANINASFKVRQGNLIDLPALTTGEIGYATDVKRLFIGNDPITFTGVPPQTEFNTGIDLDDVASNAYTVLIDEVPTTAFTIDDFVITFTTAPAAGANIVIKFNSEIPLIAPPEATPVNPSTAELSPSVTDEPFNSIAIDTERFGFTQITYALTDGTSRRSGTLRISIDDDGDATLDDNYTTSSPAASRLDHVFGGTVTDGIFVLTYTCADPNPVQMTWIEQSFAVADPANPAAGLVTVEALLGGGGAISYGVGGGSGGGTGNSRIAISGTTGSIADGATYNLDIPSAAKTYSIFSITTDAAAWVRVYSSDIARNADSSRLEGMDPESDAGVHAEVITTSATTVKFTPASICWNDAGNDTVYLAITNKSGSTTAVEASLAILKME
ncbi:hypothetical protein N8072_00815 [bacterium]|nr:hypothetical protein [bacterium]MDC1257201.1 hypothetical protein [bacterium]